MFADTDPHPRPLPTRGRGDTARCERAGEIGGGEHAIADCCEIARPAAVN
jgi:hypothetical protein